MKTKTRKPRPKARKPLRGGKFTLHSPAGTRLVMHTGWPFVAEHDDILDKHKGKR